ncbi:WD repeat-containing protein 90 [Liparis tanakae]|uniref:WD repeat-containing protein 90 n=1 Tax=Liparis tanakae TaxID=230148 RepID=A0A4Z2FPP8_9TELE|nr:WD repeat-containing protein 90 [Liparis tanakae]
MYDVSDRVIVSSTGLSFSEAKTRGLACSRGTGPMPRDMSYPVPEGGSWHDLYDYIRAQSTMLIPKQSSEHHAHP